MNASEHITDSDAGAQTECACEAAPRSTADMTPRWYVLNYIPPTMSKRMLAEAVVERFNGSMDCALEVFAPTIVKMVESGGKLTRKATPLLFHYVFVRGTLAEVKRLCTTASGFSFLLSHGESSRYVVIPDREMEAFRIIAKFHGNQLPCFAADEVDLEEGDIVEVVRGDFPGLTGTYIPKQRGRSGNLYISVTNSLSAVVYDIKVEYLRVIEFAKGGKRAYQQIDAFVPRLFAAMRVFSTGTYPDSHLIAPLLMFCNRLGGVKIDDTKLDAKLRALLMGASLILGDEAGYDRARQRYDRISSALTNPWSRALSGLVLAVAEGHHEGIAEAYAMLPPPSARESKTQERLREEFQFYLNDQTNQSSK